MDLDLRELRRMHPRLPEDVSVGLASRAGHALQRAGHEPGVETALEVERVASRGRLRWVRVRDGELGQHDRLRVTEDGAEAVALATAHRSLGWRVVRRMQRKEHADWLLEREQAGRRELAAFEVSGLESGSMEGRMTEKLAQVAKSEHVQRRWAGVVVFEEPAAVLRSTAAKRHGR